MQNIFFKIIFFGARRANWYSMKKKLQSRIRKNEWGFICPYGIGDIYFLCALMDEFFKKRKGSVKFFVKPAHEEIPRMFGFNNVEIVLADIKLAEIERKSELMPGRIIVAHPANLGLRKYIKLIGRGNVLLLDLFKKMLYLPRDTVLSNPIIFDFQRIAAKEILEKHAYIANKTVILAPDAVSTAVLPEIFWQKLADRLLEKGLKVFFNKSSSVGVYLGHECINFKLGEAISISELAGTVISVRSGICDLLSTAKTKLVVIYPDTKWYSGSVYEGSSLVRMGMSKTIEEFIYKDGQRERIIDKILNKVL